MIQFDSPLRGRYSPLIVKSPPNDRLTMHKPNKAA